MDGQGLRTTYAARRMRACHDYARTDKKKEMIMRPSRMDERGIQRRPMSDEQDGRSAYPRGAAGLWRLRAHDGGSN